MNHKTRRAGGIRAVIAQLAVVGLVAGTALVAASVSASADLPGPDHTHDHLTQTTGQSGNCGTLTIQAHHDEGEPHTTDQVAPDHRDHGSDSGGNLEVCKSGPTSVTAGQTGFTYVITVSGSLVHNGATLQVSDTAPGNVTFQSVSAPGWNCTLPGNTTLQCSTTVSGNSVSNITITANVGASATGTLHNCATLTGTVPWRALWNDISPDTGHDHEGFALDPITGCWDTTVTGATPSTTSGLSIFKAGPTSAQSGSNVTYTITVTNNGPGASGLITVSDSLPGTTSFVSWANSDPSSPWSCGLAGQVLTCTHAGLASGTSSSFSVNVLVGSSAVNNILTNCATIIGGDTSTNAADNNSCTSTSNVVTQVLAATAAAPAPVAVSPALTG